MSDQPQTSETPKFETLAIHAGQEPDGDTGARALPIYQTTSFVFPDAQSAADRFALTEAGPIYTRITNPTQGAVEDRIAALEGGAAGLLLASGQSAITLSILNLAGAGDNVVVSPSLYGGTHNLFKHTLARLGIEARFVTEPGTTPRGRAWPMSAPRRSSSSPSPTRSRTSPTSPRSPRSPTPPAPR